MDLHLSAAAPTDEERAAVDDLLGPALPTSAEPDARVEYLAGRVTRAGHEARAQRTMLLPALHALQARVGWISEGGLNYVCSRLTVPPAEAYGVATFYAMFSVEPRPATVVHVCDDLACRVNGGRELLASCGAELGPEAHVVASPCLGLCDRAPAVLVQKAGEGRTDVPLSGAWTQAPLVRRAVADEPVILETTLAGGLGVALPLEAPAKGSRLLARVGRVDPASLDDYRANDGYEALAKAVELGRDATIQQITDAKLLGRGGAAFPTGVKWRAVADQPVMDRYVIGNADESEPGTFKDRVVMERDPFAVIEALTIAGFATGAEKGFLYVRGEYPIATERLEHAIDECRRTGLLGHDVMGAGFRFDIELRRGAGAYICGEETALLDSLEGRRGQPRLKPPFPAVAGLYASPTVVNNVETIANVPYIVRNGADWLRQWGTEKSPGFKLMSVSGHVKRPGVYEVALGTTMRQLLEYAGGMRNGGDPKFWLPGGSSVPMLTAEHLDVPLTYEDMAAAGTMLGTATPMVFDETVSVVKAVTRWLEFYSHESCGKCTPCREGTGWIAGTLEKFEAGHGSEHELGMLEEICGQILGRSFCALGDAAATPFPAALKHFPEEFLAGTHTAADVAFDPAAATVLPAGAAR